MTQPAPETWATCTECDGEGSIEFGITVYEPGCGFSHPDTDSRPCTGCGGAGGDIVDATPDPRPLTQSPRCPAQGPF